MNAEYERWLRQQSYSENTVAAQLYRCRRVEEWYGNLDEHFQNDQCRTVIELLRQGGKDGRLRSLTPSESPLESTPQKNLSDYRRAVEWYCAYRSTGHVVVGEIGTERISDLQIAQTVESVDDLGQRIGLERDMQAALRLNINQLEDGLTIIDEGVERSVDSGFIDITARDSSQAIVVIELKTGVAGQRAIAQLLSYMGDIQLEEPKSIVRGILVAGDFDAKARAAARVVPSLTLKRYGIRFSFSDVDAA